MPVIVTAIQAIGDPRWGYPGLATSTGGSAVLMIVNGSISQEEIKMMTQLIYPPLTRRRTNGRQK